MKCVPNFYVLNGIERHLVYFSAAILQSKKYPKLKVSTEEQTT